MTNSTSTYCVPVGEKKSTCLHEALSYTVYSTYMRHYTKTVSNEDASHATKVNRLFYIRVRTYAYSHIYIHTHIIHVCRPKSHFWSKITVSVSKHYASNYQKQLKNNYSRNYFPPYLRRKRFCRPAFILWTSETSQRLLRHTDQQVF